MSLLKKPHWKEHGGSLLMVITVVAISLGSIGYVITNLLPQLQSEKKKMEMAINYRVFMASINDYLLHGMRERWCLNVSPSGITDLLPSNNCRKGVAMEDIVTYRGNLERLLWTEDNIGSPQTGPVPQDKANRILPLNHYRYEQGLTSRKLRKEEIFLPDGKMNFTVDRKTLLDMNESHPLYIISKTVRNCIEAIDIELFQVRDINNMPISSERKIGIKIDTKITRTSFSCMTNNLARSTSYYTFYPRRLHTFSLLKYGDLDSSLYNEYHGPVYVAGNLKLPAPEHNSDKSSLFYNTLTLGVFNQGGGEGSEFRAGRIVTNTGKDYTFQERGHPYLSKNDNYPGFRGFLGGVRLDSSEDKGFYNLFNWSSTSSGNIETLEACIEETRAITTPSSHAGSILAYTDPVLSSNYTSLKLSLAKSKRNRFALSDEAPQIRVTPEGDKKFEIAILPVKEGVRSMGSIRFKDSTMDQDFQSDMGEGAEVQFSLNLAHFKLDTAKVDDFLSNFSSTSTGPSAKPTKDNYRSVIDMDHILYDLPERREFEEEAKDLIRSCERRTGKVCENIGFEVDPKCTSFFCDHSRDWDNYEEKRTQLLKKLEEIKRNLADENMKPEMSFSFNSLPPVNGKLIRNQTTLAIKFKEGWTKFYPLVRSRLPDMNFKITTYHLGLSDLSLKLRVGGDYGSEVALIRQDNNDLSSLSGYGWRNTYNNKQLKFSEYPEPVFDLDCPAGMGLADWDLDMSASTNFAWNYANTPAGVPVDTSDHSNLPKVIFDNSFLEGFTDTTKSVVESCIVEPDRTHIYGFYVCKKLTIKPRTKPLYMIGTFIVKDLVQSVASTHPIYWYSVWEAKANDLIMTDLKKNVCPNSSSLLSMTFKDFQLDPMAKARADSCSPLELVANGPNNFSWTTVDPDIGIAKEGDVMTSQKTNRIQKWIIKEESRIELIR
jgi:hypothetical protein